jgi:hypothetical protein
MGFFWAKKIQLFGWLESFTPHLLAHLYQAPFLLSALMIVDLL